MARKDKYKINGSMIRTEREVQDKTPKEMSFETGISLSTISRIETGFYKNPPMETLKKLAEFLHIKTKSLLTNAKT